LSTTGEFVWHKVAELDELADGRVKTVTAGRTSLALTHLNGKYGALENHCPHQGGPLGEGSIETTRGTAWLRCPWHGYDYDPITGSPPPGFTDAPKRYDVDVREDGVYVALPPERARARTVSDLMVDTMIAWGVTHVFGMVGHSNLGFADAMRAAEERGDLTFIGIRHEGAAAFAASAYGKLTGRLGACFAIAGPGSTNLLTGLYDAKVDRAPVLAISGQVPSKVRGRGAFQDLDLSAAFGDVAVSTETVLRDSDHVELMNLACKHALVHRGVAHLVLPDDVQTVGAAEAATAGGPSGRIPDAAVAPAPQSIERVAELLRGAKRPIVIVGHGARSGIDDIVRLAEHLNAPIVSTFKAKGIVADDHPLAAGVLGRSGTPVASWLMNESDLLVVFGASFSNHTGIASYKPIVQIDSDPEALGRFHSVTVPVLGDVGVTARLLVDIDVDTIDQRDDVAARQAIWREEKGRRRTDDRGNGVASAALFEALARHVPENAVIAVDVGNNTYSFGRYFECKPGQHVLMSGYLGSIGFGFPAAMGAWAAAPDRPIVAVTGDGGFGQYLAEVTTAVKYRMNITHVLLNNCQLGKIAKEQRAAEWDVWQTSLHNPDFAAYARLCGAYGERVTKASELDHTLQVAFAHEGPSLVEVMTDADLV
jgi:thiamine pyrophosphate-dependent acetolactate synthase large subunit-like protein/nitrite reductase/ring-hydroxylating ferredoxin subunit